MRVKNKKRPGAQLQRMLLQPIPETPVPQPYFNIPRPDAYRFPLSETLLEGIKLIEHYFPQDVNQNITNKLSHHKIERMNRFKQTYCMLGKYGNGLLIGNHYLPVKDVSAFAYGPTHLIIAYNDLKLEIYDMNQKLLKTLKNFSLIKITFLKILNKPKTFESILLLSNCGKKVMIHRIEKSLFSTFSCKLNKNIIQNLQFPVTQMIEIPLYFRYYLQKNINYKDCSIIGISSVNNIYIIRINYYKLTTDIFWDIVYNKRIQQKTTNSISWGQAYIQSSSRDIKGDKLILMYSFGNFIYFLAFKDTQNYQNHQIIQKYQWIQSYSFILDHNQKVAFCQYIKKNQILIITENNSILIFHTRNFNIFDKEIHQKDIEIIEENFNDKLEARVISTVNQNKILYSRPKQQQIGYTTLQNYQQDLALVAQKPLLTYTDTFSYQYPSNEIYFLTDKSFGLYVYCNWKLIADILKVQQRYESAMLFLIAMYKKVNKFDLDLQGSQKQLSEYIQVLAIDFINNKISKIKSIPEIVNKICQNQQFFKLIITPIEFLTQTQQYIFLFQVVQDKIIASLMITNDDNCYKIAQNTFYQALAKFIQHGRIKHIPQNKLEIVLNYYIQHDQLDLIDRFALYCDLNRIDRSTLIQNLLNTNLVVSLAHVCTQGNQGQFVTPFVRFWAISKNYKLHNQLQYAATYAFRALWYVKLCLQRNWILKQYSLDKYSQMISILSTKFLTEQIITNLLQIRLQYCLETLSYYFTIDNSSIVNNDMKLNLGLIIRQKWIQNDINYEKLAILLSAIIKYVNKAITNQYESSCAMNLFLSSIIIYKTIKFTNEKYLLILQELITNYESIKDIKYGLQDQKIQQFEQQLNQIGCSNKDIDKILSCEFIIKILTLVYYQCQKFIINKLSLLFEKARQYNLVDLEAEISFFQGNFNTCVDLYLRDKLCIQMLIFKFLENSFKRLILERRNQQKKQLSYCLTKQIKFMVSLNAYKTKAIVQMYLPQIHQQLIQALNDDQQLQLQYLQGIILTNDDKNPNSNQNQNANKLKSRIKLSQKSILRFIELLAKYKSQDMIDIFKKNPHFSIEESLKICQQYQIYDCMEYLYQRMGSIVQSVKIAALRIDKIFKNRNQIVDQNTAPFIKINQILENTIEVCRKNHSDEIWQSLLDSSIDLYHKYIDLNCQNDMQIFFHINAQILQNLALNCTIQHTISLLQNKYQNLNMGGQMTKAFINILSNLSHSINILYLATNLIQNSLQIYLQNDYISKLKPYITENICQTCHGSLMKCQKTFHFKCGHSYHKQCIIYQDPLVCILCLKQQTGQFTYYLNTLNPKYPKIKKVKELLEKFNQKKFQMSQLFRIKQFEKIEMKQENIMKKRVEKKIQKFNKFDHKIKDIQQGDRRVLEDLYG